MSTIPGSESSDPMVRAIEQSQGEWESEFGDDVNARRTTNFEGKH